MPVPRAVEAAGEAHSVPNPGCVSATGSLPRGNGSGLGQLRVRAAPGTAFLSH